MFTRLKKMEVLEETKIFFEAMKDEVKTDIATSQQEMKESHNAMKEEIKRDLASVQNVMKDEVKRDIAAG